MVGFPLEINDDPKLNRREFSQAEAAAFLPMLAKG